MSNLLILKEDDGKRRLFTKNLVPGRKTYGEDLVSMRGEEYRSWDPYRSKLAAGVLKGLPEDVIGPGNKVLYLGASTGTTISHVSDLVGADGLVIGVEMSARVGREFLEDVAKVRQNVIPFIADARETQRFRGFGKVRAVYCDIAQRDQTEIALANCEEHLEEGGRLILIVKARSIDGLRDPAALFKEEATKVKGAGFSVERVIELSPFDKDHALISAVRSSARK